MSVGPAPALCRGALAPGPSRATRQPVCAAHKGDSGHTHLSHSSLFPDEDLPGALIYRATRLGWTSPILLCSLSRGEAAAGERRGHRARRPRGSAHRICLAATASGEPQPLPLFLHCVRAPVLLQSYQQLLLPLPLIIHVHRLKFVRLIESKLIAQQLFSLMREERSYICLRAFTASCWLFPALQAAPHVGVRAGPSKK